jgi:hypothetical protein
MLLSQAGVTQDRDIITPVALCRQGPDCPMAMRRGMFLCAVIEKKKTNTKHTQDDHKKKNKAIHTKM